MHTRTEEHARRTVELRHNDALRTIDNKGPVGRHVRNRAQEDVLNHGIKILMIRVGAIELQLRLQRNTVRQAALEALLDAVTGRVDIIVKEL